MSEAPLFDAYLMVDWSAASVPTRGRDSIWIALAERRAGGARLTELSNGGTRHEAMARIAELLVRFIEAGQRVIAGFDFGFGYPAGASKTMCGTADWRSLWAMLAERVSDGPDNVSNRFELAAELNRTAFGGPVFWGHPRGRIYEGLAPTRGDHAGLPARRIVEQRVPSAKSVWQMAYTGSVGSQTMLGIAALERLRTEPCLERKAAVWPFETAFAEALSMPITIAEIYPSLFPVKAQAGEVKDAAQVRTVACAMAALDGEGRLAPLLAAPADLSTEDREIILREEGWIVGAGLPKSMLEPSDPVPLAYERDPSTIYRQSFAAIEREADLSRFPKTMRNVAVRLIHACGMVDILDDFGTSPNAADAGREALQDGAPIICDVEMVRNGIIQSRLPAGNPVLCLLNDERVGVIALEQETTRSAAQLELWREHLAGAVVVIGNAPTALFRLLELIDAGAPKPALIIGMPVGFVGAAESKAELAADPRGVPFMTIAGRRGGSAMAAAAVNALAGEGV